MKRWLQGVFLMLFVGMSMLAYVPSALAYSSGAGCPAGDPADNTGCIVLEVNFDKNPKAFVTVHVHREQAVGQDDDFDLDERTFQNYSSYNKVSVTGTQPGSPCNPGLGGHTGNNTLYFDITVTYLGKLIGSMSHVDLCRDILQDSEILSKTINIVMPTDTPDPTAPGGFEGTVKVAVTATDIRPCQFPLLVFNPTQKQFGGGENGVYTTGLVLPPGDYKISGVCKLGGAISYPINATGKVVGGKFTHLDITVGDAAPDVEVPKDPPLKCDAGKGFTWIICGIIRTLVSGVDWVRDAIIVPFLKEKPLDKDTDKDALAIFNVWSGFRNVASILFILIFFLIIFGTALGWDNYTVKKALPRLVAGAIFVPFSWYLCVLVIDTGNVLGQGLLSLTSTIIPAADIDFSSSISKLMFGGLLVAGAAATFAALATVGLGIVITMALGFALVLLTLVLRKILITLLIVLSPFAFIAWILPNTEKWFQEWWANFFKLVMMYPIIMMLFEAGRLFASAAGATSAGIGDTVRPFFQIIALTLPLYGVPFAFKWAGSGLALGHKAIGRATGGINKRYGQGSERDKIRAEERQANSAARAMDIHNNPMNSKTLGAIKRGVNMKRSGLGGFLGNSGIPLLRNSTAQKQRLNKAAAEHESHEAQSEARNEIRHHQPQTSKDSVANQTEAAIGSMMDARIHEAELSMKSPNGTPLNSLTLTSGDDDSKKRIDTARQTGDIKKVIEALRSSSGSIDHITAMVEEEFASGRPDKFKVGAALSKLKGSQSGFNRAIEIAQGRIEDQKDTAGRVTGYKGGGGVDADGRKALLGGDDENEVSEEWKDIWKRSTKGASSMDAGFSIADVSTNYSGDDIQSASPAMTRRLVAFYDRNRTGPLAETAAQGVIDFNKAARDIQQSSVLRAGTTNDVKAVIATASTLDHPVITDPALGAYFRDAVTPAPPPPETPKVMAQQILAATNGNIVHASQIHQQITNEISASTENKSELHTNIANRILETGKLQPEDLATVGAPTAPAPLAPTETAMDSALEKHIVAKLGDNLDELAALERRFATDDSYRHKVREAFLRGAKIPPASS